MSVWESKHKEKRDQSITLKRYLRAIEDKEERLLNVYVHEGGIDKETYIAQKDKLAEEKALLRIEMREEEGEQLDLESVLAFAEKVLNDPAKMWRQLGTKQRLKFQHLFFPEGLVFDGESFGTPKTSSLFK